MPGSDLTEFFRLTEEIAALARKAGGAAQLEWPMFLAFHEEDVFNRLIAIYRNTSSDENRFVSISLAGENPPYVQALIPKNSEMVLCEVESGFYRDAPLHFSPEARASLKNHGYSTDASAGNFQCEMGPVMEEDDLHGIAHNLLAVLCHVYGARFDSELKFDAPLTDDE